MSLAVYVIVPLVAIAISVVIVGLDYQNSEKSGVSKTPDRDPRKKTAMGLKKESLALIQVSEAVQEENAQLLVVGDDVVREVNHLKPPRTYTSDAMEDVFRTKVVYCPDVESPYVVPETPSSFPKAGDFQ